jgi:DNA-binding NarL/FixJ family response regulator
MAKRILVMVIEENRLLRDRLAALLQAQPDFQVVAVAEGANVGLLERLETKPHVVLVDATLGNHDSRLVVESVSKTAPEARVIVMDLLPAQEDIIEFIKAGARGFIVKDATVEDFVRTIRSVAKGADVVPPALTGALLSHIADPAVLRNMPALSTPALMEGVRMTKRERQVIDLVSDGLDNKEIAQRLNLTAHTVKNYVRHILEKLALHSRLQLSAFAHKAVAPKANPAIPPLTHSPATKRPKARRLQGLRHRGAGQDRTDE